MIPLTRVKVCVPCGRMSVKVCAMGSSRLARCGAAEFVVAAVGAQAKVNAVSIAMARPRATVDTVATQADLSFPRPRPGGEMALGVGHAVDDATAGNGRHTTT